MAAAEVGDDVFGDDPTVNRLQERACEIFEKEAALWVPTGCMGNEIAVKVHSKPGQEIVTEDRGHILNYELGAAAVISGVTIRAVRSGDGSGHLTWDEIAPFVKVDPPYFQAATGLVCLENTHNFAGGSVMNSAARANGCEKVHAVGLPVHMDGARIFNASVALNERVADLTRDCDSVMFTLSKGLGAPAGSVLLGTKEFIQEAEKFLSMEMDYEIKILIQLMEFNKADVIELAKSKKINKTYSCHSGAPIPCGKCISCLEIKNALKKLKQK